MSTHEFAEYLAELDRFARGRSAAEETYRREIAAKMAELERSRAFAFRRLSLTRTIAEAVAPAATAEEAAAFGKAACLREVGWTGATESQREVMTRFAPVAITIWDVSVPPPAEAEPARDAPKPTGAAIDRAFAAFETWYEANRQGTFWHLMDQEPVDLPLVEIA